MIPYFIQRAIPNDDIREDNIDTTTGFSNKENIDNEIITSITTFMYEFCSEKYGYDIKITSYEDFCNQFWEISEFKIRYWQQIFKVFYFENNKWTEWDIQENANKIYDFYVNTYLL
jgi:hypothetical protein